MQSIRTKIVDTLRQTPPVNNLRVKGWLRTIRQSKNVLFMQVNDGSCLASLQVVVTSECENFAEASQLLTGSAVEVVGDLIPSSGKGQSVEVQAHHVKVIGHSDAQFPLQKKHHSFEFLRTIAHLRARTNTFSAVFRVRSALAQAVHNFFQERGFVYVHTPIITASDCEGAGEMFRVTTLNVESPPRTATGAINWDEDFFARPTFLTVSGQLNGEAMAMGLSDIYTFGPTFRAENSNTARHVAEFWMIEPEMAWFDIEDNANLAEAFLKYLLQTAFERCAEDLQLFNERIDQGLIARLEHVAQANFERMRYAEAIDRLEKSSRTFTYPVYFGANLQAEHERYLTEEVVGRPLFVFDYPKEIKAFYMRRNDDGRTVAAMDLLVPKIGELIGGSQREERYDVLKTAMVESGLNPEHYAWYLDLRKFGTVPHAGFGLGFERAIMYITGMENIRDVIAFPRTPRNCEF